MGIFKDRVSKGKCGRCGKNAISSPKKQCDSCLSKQRETQKAIRLDRKGKKICVLCGKRKAYKNFTYCRVCKKELAKWQKDNKELGRLAQKRWRLKLREEVIKVYGSVCRCCGEKEDIFLTIDHINNDGANHRRMLTGTNRGSGSWNTYIWLKKNNFPSGFQVLCWNCNWAKSHGGCPHRKL
ncbi:MAG: hypothetical protein GTO02_05820 [Candidatus Dadabacteria bacterium]|nr:hypothetical protein [Candidatus Dadabacteria bacterium]